ncbi:MAG: YidC/Oxa1 family membrane protein insertase [Elusimicrobiota bacterium]|jgi:YidC/Oxa1 family membrane protein insertase|nr:YidC/Oxa1 family membrane protein insertase [Elusimicrobiota bacterium]
MHVLEVFLKSIFDFLYFVFHSYGFSIILLSAIVSVILLPFYYLASKLEKKETILQSKLSPKIDLINKINDSHLRHKQLRVLYSSYGYSPIYSLRSLSSLLIQIPFFIAAYQMLSGYKALKGVKFLFLKDLGQPDTLLLGVSILPILMIIINILCAILISKSGSKERKQSYFIAVFILILLYTSPAGLVLYWTCNNLISLMRYLVSYIKENKPIVLLNKSAQALKSAIVSRGMEDYVGAFFIFIALYFVINITALGGFAENKYFLRILLLPLYFAVICQIYSFVKTNFCFQIANQEIIISLKTKQNNAFKKLIPIIILFAASFYVFKYERPHYLLAILVLFSIFNFRNVKNELKQYLKVQIFTISAIAFPAVLYVKSNIIYFTSVDIIIYMIILILFAYLLPIISKLFNYKLSYDDNLCFCAAFILSAMFIPLIRDAIIYSGNTPIDFVIVFAIVLFIINSLKRYRKIVQVFFISSALLLTALSIYNSKEIAKKLIFASAKDRYLAAAIIPTELLEMDMKDTPSIYLFMHDAFPAKQLAEKLKLDYSGIELLYKKYNFKAYDVYSLGRGTMATMASVFNMDIYGFDITKLLDVLELDTYRRKLSGDNRLHLLLQAKGYKTGAYIANNRYFFNNKVFYDFDIAQSLAYNTEDRQIVLLSIMQGRTESMLLRKNIKDGQSVRAARFARFHANEDKLFVWATGGPNHSSLGKISNEQEIKNWMPRYYGSIKEFERELQLTVSANPNAIIIFMSDHGPWMLGDNTREYAAVDEKEIDSISFRDSYGAAMAIRWPDKERAAKYDKEFYVVQDLFPIILAYLYDSALPLKYKPQNTAVRLKSHKFDKGKFYPYFYKDMQWYKDADLYKKFN